MNKEKTISHINSIGDWFEKNEYKGYDLYDLYDVSLFHNLITDKPVILRKINRKIITWWIKIFPESIIRIFKIKKNINPKAMGLLLKGYCLLYLAEKRDAYLNRAKNIAQWLDENSSIGITGKGWGYPFDWSGSIFIPKYTPSSVVTTACADGFYSLFKITNDEKYLIVCKDVCKFIVEDLNIDYIDNDKLCFSYTPIDNDHVNNANLFAAEFLIKMGIETNNHKFISYGQKAVNYTLSQQTSEGSILYWGNEDKKRMKMTFSNLDHYHTGFELRMLWSITNMIKDPNIEKAFELYSKFYFKKFINNSIPLYRPNTLYPVNIHACAESIICNLKISNGSVVKNAWFTNMVNWINENMVDTDNLYIYEINKLFFLKFKTKFKFHRWAQAWMFLALSEYYMALTLENND